METYENTWKAWLKNARSKKNENGKKLDRYINLLFPKGGKGSMRVVMFPKKELEEGRTRCALNTNFSNAKIYPARETTARAAECCFNISRDEMIGKTYLHAGAYMYSPHGYTQDRMCEIHALVVDVDDCPLEGIEDKAKFLFEKYEAFREVTPTIIVDTGKKGFQAYWVTRGNIADNTALKTGWRKAMGGFKAAGSDGEFFFGYAGTYKTYACILQLVFGGDPKVVKASPVVRMPYSSRFDGRDAEIVWDKGPVYGRQDLAGRLLRLGDGYVVKNEKKEISAKKKEKGEAGETVSDAAFLKHGLRGQIPEWKIKGEEISGFSVKNAVYSGRAYETELRFYGSEEDEERFLRARKMYETAKGLLSDDEGDVSEAGERFFGGKRKWKQKAKEQDPEEIAKELFRTLESEYKKELRSLQKRDTFPLAGKDIKEKEAAAKRKKSLEEYLSACFEAWEESLRDEAYISGSLTYLEETSKRQHDCEQSALFAVSEKEKGIPAKTKKTGQKPHSLGGFLHGRKKDLENLLSESGNNLTGHRNVFLYVYANTVFALCGFSASEEFRKKVYGINASFSEPLSEAEAEGIIKSVEKKWRNYSDARLGEILPMGRLKRPCREYDPVKAERLKAERASFRKRERGKAAKAVRRSKKAKEKFEAAMMFLAGESKSEIARVLGRARNTVIAWLKETAPFLLAAKDFAKNERISKGSDAFIEKKEDFVKIFNKAMNTAMPNPA